VSLLAKCQTLALPLKQLNQILDLSETGAMKMAIQSQIIWIIIYTITSCTIFYTLGHAQGKKDGYWRGRSVGMRIGSERQGVNS